MITFNGKTGLVTGGGSGIGRATAIGFARAGGVVAIADINEENANKVAAEITSAGGKAFALRADVSKPEEVDAMIASAHRQLGRLDFLHNNAFGLPSSSAATEAAGSVETLSDDIWDQTIAVGLTAVFRATKRVLPIMRGQGCGAIVNTASISGLRADYGIAAYNAAKAAVINFTRVVAIEYARRGIRCNCICPGAIHTPLLQPALDIPGFADQFTSIIPMGRLGRPEEMANVVLFLASDLASFVTGVAFVADGGQTAKTGSPAFGTE